MLERINQISLNLNSVKNNSVKTFNSYDGYLMPFICKMSRI